MVMARTIPILMIYVMTVSSIKSLIWGKDRDFGMNSLHWLRTVGKKANIKYMSQPRDVPFTNADVSKENRQLGYEFKFIIEEGIKKYCGVV